MVALAGSAPVAAQDLRDQLSTLFTAQGAAPAGQAPDLAAALQSRDALLGLFAIELTTIPVSSGTTGFVYQLNPSLGVVERASDSFGAFFTERALRTGEGQFSFGLVYQGASFSAIQGRDLESGSFPVNATRTAGASDPYASDTLTLDLSTRTLTARAVYGVTDALDVAAAVPFVQTRFDGSRLTTYSGQTTFDIVQQGSASGLGDIGFTARYRLLGQGGRGLALGSDVRLPTGRAADLLGTGSLAVRGQAIASWEEGPLAASANLGAGAGGASDEIFWGGAVTMAASPRVTLVGEVLGRRLSDLHRVAQIYQPHPALGGVETMRWLPDEESAVSIGYAVTGVKWNVSGTVLIGANLLVRLTDAGVRARVTPALTVEYDFSR